MRADRLVSILMLLQSLVPGAGPAVGQDAGRLAAHDFPRNGCPQLGRDSGVCQARGGGWLLPGGGLPYRSDRAERGRGSGSICADRARSAGFDGGGTENALGLAQTGHVAARLPGIAGERPPAHPPGLDRLAEPPGGGRAAGLALPGGAAPGAGAADLPAVDWDRD